MPKKVFSALQAANKAATLAKRAPTPSFEEGSAYDPSSSNASGDARWIDAKR